MGTLLTGKKVKARVIYFIGTAGPVVHDDSKFFEYTDFTLCQMSHGEIKQCNTSVAFSNTFQACHAIFLPFPTSVDTV